MISRFNDLKNKLLKKQQRQEILDEKTSQDIEEVVARSPVNEEPTIEVRITSQDGSEVEEVADSAEEDENDPESVTARTIAAVEARLEGVKEYGGCNEVIPEEEEEEKPEEEEEEEVQEQAQEEVQEQENEEEEEEDDSPTASPIQPEEEAGPAEPEQKTPEKLEESPWYKENESIYEDAVKNMNTVRVFLVEAAVGNENTGPYSVVVDSMKPPKPGYVRLLRKVRIINPFEMVPARYMFMRDESNQNEAMEDFNKFFTYKEIKAFRFKHKFFATILENLDNKLREIQTARKSFYLDEESLKELRKAGHIPYIIDKFEDSIHQEVCFYKAKAWRYLLRELDYICHGECKGLKIIEKTIDRLYWQKVCDFLENGEEFLEIIRANIPWNLYRVFQDYVQLN